jgi:NADPH:quinone reductase-like Zn-dependent oxidoreductase
MKQLVIPEFGLDKLAFRDAPETKAGPGENLVEVKAVSLNYRDLLVAKGLYNPKMPLPRVPGSDAAGVVLEVGEGVTEFQPGDRVCGTFFQDWDEGYLTEAATKSALGGAIDGVFAERIVLKSAVKFPDHLSFTEAATLPCAAVTAWNALAGIEAGQSVLVQGTGGVSLFALQFAAAAGAKVYVTSSDDIKLGKALALGATAGTNYRTHPDWDKWVKEQTGGKGVDKVMEVGGAGTLDRSVKAVRYGGEIALIGVLAGGSTFNPLPMMMKAVTLRSIFVGHRFSFECMNRFLEKHAIHPVIDRVFPFAEVVEAFQYLESGKHFGKVVVSME